MFGTQVPNAGAMTSSRGVRRMYFNRSMSRSSDRAAAMSASAAPLRVEQGPETTARGPAVTA
ncbi:hypothetical protein SAMN05444336_1011173 [Albimonas donghaensis]|uniref:Uncharacterized protein n=1 Tax=Albimonas donghaensis TaxID=356660 RepID=A0A1H2U1Y4_9RHOB|nr:hypothetical protein [Albimonas donghaensis]SDW49414.1 hypothetical protein SAMN05444336_1011173 [Albimonas donghaensis]